MCLNNLKNIFRLMYIVDFLIKIMVNLPIVVATRMRIYAILENLENNIRVLHSRNPIFCYFQLNRNMIWQSRLIRIYPPFNCKYFQKRIQWYSLLHRFSCIFRKEVWSMRGQWRIQTLNRHYYNVLKISDYILYLLKSKTINISFS